MDFGASSASSIDSNITLVGDVNGRTNGSPDLSPSARSAMVRQEALSRMEELRRGRVSDAEAMPMVAQTPSTQPFLTPLNPVPRHQQPVDYDPQTGLRVYTNGPSMQKQDQQNSADPQSGRSEQQDWVYPPPTSAHPVQGPEQSGLEAAYNRAVEQQNAAAAGYPNPSAGPDPLTRPPSVMDSPGGSRIRVRRSTFSPAWSVAPRVLLVDDDQVSRRLFSKFLQVSGCTIDVAVDGIGAVNKMNLEKYDLVLMVSLL